MTPAERIDRLDQRRRYLEKRVQIKQAMGWEYQYDESEREALAWALDTIEILGAVAASAGSRIEP